MVAEIGEPTAGRPPVDMPLKFTSFSLVSQEDVRKIINTAKSTSCELDPIPTWLLKQTLEPLLPVITSMVNKSLEMGLVPDSMKSAIIVPLLKKILLDPEILKNFRPVSNLTFLSKVVEKTASKQLSEHCNSNSLEDPFQSAYKCCHSTETALVRVQNDILMAIDKQKVCLLLLLDLSAAFDTVDHNLLLTRLNERFGIDGTPLKWIESYLTDRKQSVIIDGIKSSPKDLDCGVPQGSILGPEFFVKYASPVGDIIRRHGLQYHIYADDTQIYIFFDVADTDDAIRRVEDCIVEIRAWMSTNWLKFNDGKTEMILLGSKHQLAKMAPTKIRVGASEIEPSTSARNIGVIFDKHMSMKDHVMATCKAANYQLRNIGQIRKYLTNQAAEKLVHAFVTSKLDYGNALLFGLPDNTIHKLQRVQNTAARIVTRTRKYDHITPVLKQLHWLPVKDRINFKIMLLTFKTLNGKGPKYISDLLTLYKPPRSLRSGSQMLLVEPVTNLVTFGGRSFSKAAPQLWNSLPLDIRESKSVEQFKGKLKYHLFLKFT
jgi:hypothetical protein